MWKCKVEGGSVICNTDYNLLHSIMSNIQLMLGKWMAIHFSSFSRQLLVRSDTKHCSCTCTCLDAIDGLATFKVVREHKVVLDSVAPIESKAKSF